VPACLIALGNQYVGSRRHRLSSGLHRLHLADGGNALLFGPAQPGLRVSKRESDDRHPFFQHYLKVLRKHRDEMGDEPNSKRRVGLRADIADLLPDSVRPSRISASKQSQAASLGYRRSKPAAAMQAHQR
jgi:hypothetical protein